MAHVLPFPANRLALVLDTLRPLLARLEVPHHRSAECLRECDWEPLECGCAGPCDCPVLLPPPCRHVLERDHDLTLRKWAVLLRRGEPGLYDGPPRVPRRAPPVLTREARVALYARRTGTRGRPETQFQLYRPDDPWRLIPLEDAVQAGVTQERCRNGADADGAVRAAAGKEVA